MTTLLLMVAEWFGSLGGWIMQLITMFHPFLVLPFMFFILVIFIRLLSGEEDQSKKKKKGKG